MGIGQVGGFRSVGGAVPMAPRAGVGGKTPALQQPTGKEPTGLPGLFKDGFTAAPGPSAGKTPPSGAGGAKAAGKKGGKKGGLKGLLGKFKELLSGLMGKKGGKKAGGAEGAGGGKGAGGAKGAGGKKRMGKKRNKARRMPRPQQAPKPKPAEPAPMPPRVAPEPKVMVA